jgi:predicted peroxiredoxin
MGAPGTMKASTRTDPDALFIGHRKTHRIHLSASSLDYPLSGGNMARRQFLTQLLGLPFFSIGVKAEETKKSLKILMKSAWGSDDPTKAAFPFLHGLALAEAGHEVQMFLLGEATSLMRKATANAVVPVGWPPLGETMEKIAAKHITIFACGACCRARGVAEADLNQWGAKFGNPTIFVGLVEWADRIITE